MKRLAYLLFGCATLAMTSGCSKDDDDITPSGPKEYQVEYKVSSATATTADINYTNETGGTTTLDDVPLPATYKFKRTMKLGDSVLILASLDGGSATSEITASISLNGKEVERETGRGTGARVVPVYVIGQ